MSKSLSTRSAFLTAIIVLSIWHVYFIYQNVIVLKNAYTYGDWLISYADGFVRRGLGGEILIFISHLSGDHLGATTFVLLSVLSVATLAGLYRLLCDRLTWVDLALLIWLASSFSNSRAKGIRGVAFYSAVASWRG
jgi:hypothetical protein